jgi:Uma2 family endonuclease
MSTAPAVGAGRLLLRGVSWPEYTGFLRAFAERPGHRLTYDRGVLEIMSPSFAHELHAALLGRFVLVLVEELGLPVLSGGSVTLRRRRMRRGLEPDRCWWLAHAPQLQHRRVLDLRTDPPPDLAVEVDVTHSSLNRLAIYARLGVPEVWRLDAQGLLTFLTLSPGSRHYAEQPHSAAFPLFSPADLLSHLTLREQHDEAEVVRRFRDLVRQRAASGSSPASS